MLERIRKAGARRAFPALERVGLHLTSCDYEDPVPTVSELPDDLWTTESACLGIDMNEPAQLRFLQDACASYKKEYDAFGLEEPSGDCPYFVRNGSFGEVDGDVLYSMIRSRKPRRYVEIGSGWSTLLAAHALRKNETETGIAAELVAIEPHPRSFLRRADFGITRLVEKNVQEVGFELFESLDVNDVLFIDSSHVVKIGGDVNYEVLEILPRIRSGVLVHVHDIFLPFEYPKAWVKKLKIFYSEMYLLHAFLMGNVSFEVVWAGSWMRTRHPEVMRRLFRGEASQSFWIRRRIEPALTRRDRDPEPRPGPQAQPRVP